MVINVQVPEGNGSGVVWDDQGHIVTNYHGMHICGKSKQCYPAIARKSYLVL